MLILTAIVQQLQQRLFSMVWQILLKLSIIDEFLSKGAWRRAFCDKQNNKFDLMHSSVFLACSLIWWCISTNYWFATFYSIFHLVFASLIIYFTCRTYTLLNIAMFNFILHLSSSYPVLHHSTCHRIICFDTTSPIPVSVFSIVWLYLSLSLLLLSLITSFLLVRGLNACQKQGPLVQGRRKRPISTGLSPTWVSSSRHLWMARALTFLTVTANSRVSSKIHLEEILRQ